MEKTFIGAVRCHCLMVTKRCKKYRLSKCGYAVTCLPVTGWVKTLLSSRSKMSVDIQVISTHCGSGGMLLLLTLN